MALTFDIGANERQAVASVKNLSKALDEADKDLDTLAKNDSTDKLERSFKDLANEADDSGKKVGTSLKDGFKKAGDASQDFKQEAASTAREATASFDGSAESIGDAFQELAANAFAGFGPAAAIAGGAAAAAFGLATEAITKAKEAADEAKASTYEWAKAAVESGGIIDLKSRIDELTGSVEGLKTIQDLQTVSGWDQVDVLKALATGDGLPALKQAFDEGANSTQVATTRTLELNGALEGAAEGLRLGAEGAKITQDAYAQLGGQTNATTGEVEDLQSKVERDVHGNITITADLSQAEAAYQRFVNGVQRNLHINLTAGPAPAGIRQVG